MIDIPVNKEIDNYAEQVAAGLTMRQTLGGGLALLLGAGAYMALVDSVGNLVASWVCILLAVPPALFGFLQWHGMYLEQLLPLVLRFYFSSRRLGWKSTNYAAQYFGPRIQAAQQVKAESPKASGKEKNRAENMETNQGPAK